MDFSTAAFWTALGSIILANVVLSGDNAVVIAMAARALPPQYQRKAIVYGSGAAIVMRIILTLVAAEMLQWHYLKVIGALLLVYIGVSLLSDDDGEEGDGHKEHGTLMGAVRTILIADLVMSLDNVIAVAAAAKGHMGLLILGLAISIPLIIFGSTLLLKVMERFPIIITLGAALLGYLAGEMLLTDPAVIDRFGEQTHAVVYIAGAIGAVIVVALGTYMQKRSARSEAISA